MNKYSIKLNKLNQKINADPECDAADKQEIKDFVMQNFALLPKYFEAVINENTELAFGAGPSMIERLETQRRNAHIAACDAINKINRLSKQYGIGMFFDFPEIQNRPLEPGMLNPEGKMVSVTQNSNRDRELAAFRIYGFCKEMFLDGPDRTRYNEFENYTEREMDQELMEMSGSDSRRKPAEFNSLGNLDELLSQAELMEGHVAEEREIDAEERE
jgi:hypothetical protein